MRVLQIIPASVSEYERKSQRIDSSGLSGKHEVITEGDADIAHVYGSPGSLRITMPYVAAAPGAPSRFWRRIAPAREIVTPFNLPEAVEEIWFSGGQAPSPVPGQTGLSVPHILATYVAHRPGVRNMVEQTLVRIHRFRDDIAWKMFDSVPTPADLLDVGVWVDPPIDDTDFDGFVAEAIVAGKAVVASRTPINEHRLEKGRTGFLVPRKDPNELTHAILGSLFKPEVARLKIEAAKQTAGKFRPRQRIRVLERIYEKTVK